MRVSRGSWLRRVSSPTGNGLVAIIAVRDDNTIAATALIDVKRSNHRRYYGEIYSEVDFKTITVYFIGPRGISLPAGASVCRQKEN